MPEPHLRAADVDREAVATALGEHMAAGRLTVAEYDERLSSAYAARTYGELAELTTDLPGPAPAAGPGAPTGTAPAPSGATPAPSGATPARIASTTVRSGGGCGIGDADDLRGAWASWATTGGIVLTIWLVTSLASGAVLYFWPIWVIGPWGAFLLFSTLTAGRGGNRRGLTG